MHLDSSMMLSICLYIIQLLGSVKHTSTYVSIEPLILVYKLLSVGLSHTLVVMDTMAITNWVLSSGVCDPKYFIYHRVTIIQVYRFIILPLILIVLCALYCLYCLYS